MNERVGSEDAIRVMVVDDSTVVRGLICRMIDADPEMTVVASAGNGKVALERLEKTDVDVIILDIEMPVMDGLTALPKFLEINPEVKVIMASTLTERNAAITMRAFELGATEALAKPSSATGLGGAGDFQRELVDKAKTLGNLRRIRRRAKSKFSPRVETARVAPPKRQIKLRQPGLLHPQVLAVGSSTGGPQALFAFFKNLDKKLRVPVFITQHMPATFTTILAQNISRNTGWPCSEAEDGMAAAPGHLYLARGEHHMLVENQNGVIVVRLDQGPPENFCRPAVDPMLRSISKAFNGRVFAVILTGMGADGRKGGQVVVDAGGTVIAQDEATSTVWGMPGAAAEAGICSAILPLDDLGGHVSKVFG